MSSLNSHVLRATLIQKGKGSLLCSDLFRDRSLLEHMLAARRPETRDGNTEARGECPPLLNIIQFPIGSLWGGKRLKREDVWDKNTDEVAAFGRFFLTMGLRWLRMRLLWTNSYMADFVNHCCIQQVQHSIPICLHGTVQSVIAVHSTKITDFRHRRL